MGGELVGVVEGLKVTACSTELDESDVLLVATGVVGSENNVGVSSSSLRDP